MGRVLYFTENAWDAGVQAWLDPGEQMVSSVIYLCLSLFCFAPCWLPPQAGSFTSFQVGNLPRKRVHPFQQCRLMLTGPDQPHLIICPCLTLSLKLSYSLPWDGSVLLLWILLMQALLLTHSPWLAVKFLSPHLSVTTCSLQP